MTVENTAAETISDLGDGATTDVTIGFRFLANSQISVYLRDESTLPHTDALVSFGLAANQYQLSGGDPLTNFDPATTVVMNTPWTATQRIVVKRVTVQTQPVDYQAANFFPVDQHEDQMDRVVMMIQEMDNAIGGAVATAQAAQDAADAAEAAGQAATDAAASAAAAAQSASDAASSATSAANDASNAANAATAALNSKEDTANKSNAADLGGLTPSATLFPTQEAVKTYVDTAVSAGAVASGVAVTPVGNLASTDVQAALEEHQLDIDGLGSDIAAVETDVATIQADLASQSSVIVDTTWTAETSKTVDVSALVDDARAVSWELLDVANDYEEVFAVIKAPAIGQVTITTEIALTGTYRLVGGVGITGTGGAGVNPAASTVTTATGGFAGLLSAADDTVQKALDTLDNVNAAAVPVNTAAFDGNLSGADDTVQKALETIDDLALGSLGAAPQTFAASGTYTVPAGVTKVLVYLCGGGGGGAGGSTNTAPYNAGGGGGACGMTRIVEVTPGQNISVTVGAGGTLGNGGGFAGGNGGASYFGSLVAWGGFGGTLNSGGTGVGGGGAGGAGLTAGIPGHAAGGASAGTGRGGGGGGGDGAGGAGGSSGVDGGAGVSPGGGGGGGFGGHFQGHTNGGVGGTGLVVVCPIV